MCVVFHWQPLCKHAHLTCYLNKKNLCFFLWEPISPPSGQPRLLSASRRLTPLGSLFCVSLFVVIVVVVFVLELRDVTQERLIAGLSGC